jgi:hypothetical protein
MDGAEKSTKDNATPLADRLIEHAERFWHAEEENSRRYSNKVRVLVSIQSALLGLLLVGFPGVTAKILIDRPSVITTLGIVPSAIAVFTAAWFLLRALEFTVWSASTAKVRRLLGDSEDAGEDPPKLVASHYFRLPTGLLKHADRTLSRSEFVVFGRTYTAALDLQARNAQERWRLDLAERHLLRGLWATAIAAVLLVLVVVFQTADTIAGDEQARQQLGEAATGRQSLDSAADPSQD